MSSLEQLNQWASQLSLDEIKNMPEDEILGMAMERPGHPGQYGFMLQISYFKSQEHFTETLYALMKRLDQVNSLKEKMQIKKDQLQ